MNNVLKKYIMCIFVGMLFNNHYQSHNNDNKKLNFIHPITYNGTFNY